MDEVALGTKPNGRPRKGFDWDLLESLSAAEASLEFIAERFILKEKKEITRRSIDAAEKLIQRRIKERYATTFVVYREKLLEGKKLSLIQAMWNKAIKKDSSQMQIHLAKQYLGHSDKVDQAVQHSGQIESGPGISQEKMDQILKDPKATELAHELALRILRAHQGKEPNG